MLRMTKEELNILKANQHMVQSVAGMHIFSRMSYPVTRIEDVDRIPQAPDLSDLDFETRTLVEGLLGTGVLRSKDWPALRHALMSDEYTGDGQVKLRVLESLFAEEGLHSIKRTVRQRSKLLQHVPEVRQVDHVVMIRTVQVTPTRLLIGPPQQEASNTVTRRYSDNLDDIIRVQFVDEGDRIHVRACSGCGTDDQILDYAKQADKLLPSVGLMARVRRALNKGIMVGGKHFFPIASSGSQQK